MTIIMRTLTEFLTHQFRLQPSTTEPPKLNEKFLARYIPSDSDRFRHIVEVVKKGNGAEEAWLHDIGYSEKLNRTGFHPLDSGLFAVEQGFSETIVLAVLFHSGAYYQAQKIGGLLADLYQQLSFYHTTQDVERILRLTYWDMTTTPTGESCSVEERVEEILSRYPSDSPVYQATVYLKPTYQKISDMYSRLKQLNFLYAEELSSREGKAVI